MDEGCPALQHADHQPGSSRGWLAPPIWLPTHSGGKYVVCTPCPIRSGGSGLLDIIAAGGNLLPPFFKHRSEHQARCCRQDELSAWRQWATGGQRHVMSSRSGRLTIQPASMGPKRQLLSRNQLLKQPVADSSVRLPNRQQAHHARYHVARHAHPFTCPPKATHKFRPPYADAMRCTHSHATP